MVAERCPYCGAGPFEWGGAPEGYCPSCGVLVLRDDLGDYVEGIGDQDDATGDGPSERRRPVATLLRELASYPRPGLDTFEALGRA
jgi:hypothetical protein